MNKKTITLIRPNMGEYYATDALPPLSMAIIAARTSKEFNIKFYDDRIESLPISDTPDLVAITVETFTAHRAYQIADGYRVRGIPVVMGGYHPTFLPEEALKHADAVVCGDAEGTWEQVINDYFNNHHMRPIYQGDNSRPMDDVILDRSIFVGKKYPPIDLVWFSRGCRFACDFCSIRAFYKDGVRFRPTESVIEELKERRTRNLVLFVDDNLFVSKEGFDSLLTALEKINIRWACQISIDVARDQVLLDRMARSGCMLVLIGFESFSPANLIQMGKKWNKVSGSYSDVIRKIHERGIAVYGTFVFGYDCDTIETIEETLQFAMDTRLEIANFNPLTPTPGSPLYNRLLLEKRLLKPKWWLDSLYRYGDAIFVPKQMDPTQFSEKCFEVKKKFYSFKSIANRIILSDAGLNWYRSSVMGIANIVSRREIMKKQHHLLGR